MVVLIGGGTASGKTTMRQTIVGKTLMERGIRTVTADPDKIKNSIPEYESLKKDHPNDAARLVHKNLWILVIYCEKAEQQICSAFIA